MSDAVAKLIPLVNALSAGEQDELRTHLLGGTDEKCATEEEWEAAWAEEIERRRAEVAAGRRRLIPAEEVFARIDALLEQHEAAPV